MPSVQSMIAKRLYSSAVIATISTLSLLYTVHPGAAATKEVERAMNMVGMQQMLTQKMSKDMLLIALEVDKEKYVRDLQSSRSLFDRTLNGLRDGDVELGLIPTTNSKTLEQIGHVEGLWAIYNSTLKQSLEEEQFSRGRLETIADLNTPLLKAVDDTLSAYENEAIGLKLFTMLGSAIEVSARQRVLTQKIAKEYLLVAYGLDAERNRKNLRETSELFDRSLHGLINGDPELQLIPAPTPEIKAQLNKVVRIWNEIRPTVNDVAGGGAASTENIAQIARINGALLKTMNIAVFMYENL